VKLCQNREKLKIDTIIVKNVNPRYLPRVVDKTLDAKLRYMGAVLIEGPKWCGKSWTAAEKAASILYMQNPDNLSSNLGFAETAPSVLLEGDTPRLIDEWQTASVLWDAVRHAVDMRGKPGQFILTGSAQPVDDAVMHTGTGRIARIRMHPMSLFESLESNGAVSLNSLFEGADIMGRSALKIDDLAFAMVRGGWPASVRDKENALNYAQDYVESVENKDVSRADGVKKDPDRARSLMRSLARNIASPATVDTIMGDVASDDRTISEKTVTSYLKALRRIFVIEDLPAWSPSMRSKTVLRTSPKRYFTDPSIAAVRLNASPKGLLSDFNTFGLLFESLCVRDLRVYAQVHNGKVFHYRDKCGLEADAVVHLSDGRWGAIEVKMGSSDIEKGIENLKKVRDKVNTEKMMEPSFLMVLTAGEYAYRREDGVYIVPIGCLKD
jgi:predicted AAA+ superfamily ATPase